MTDSIIPSPALLVKLGSLIVHAEEAMGEGGHEFDKQTFDTLLSDPEVAQWLAAMRALALLPLKRA